MGTRNLHFEVIFRNVGKRILLCSLNGNFPIARTWFNSLYTQKVYHKTGLMPYLLFISNEWFTLRFWELCILFLYSSNIMLYLRKLSVLTLASTKLMEDVATNHMVHSRNKDNSFKNWSNVHVNRKNITLSHSDHFWL